jgi:hypothetical protein
LSQGNGRDEPSKTALAFTRDQLDWLHQQADRRELWLSDVFGEMLRVAYKQAREEPNGRRRRNRSGPRYIATQLHLDPEVRSALDSLAKETNRSRAAAARVIVDYVRRRD